MFNDVCHSNKTHTKKKIIEMKTFYHYLLLISVTFILHLTWENAHIGLYGGYETLPISDHITIFATVGDVAYTLFAVLLFALCKKNLNWLTEAKFCDYVLLSVFGFLISLFVEYKALILEKWFYLPTMPIIPFLNVGLSPIIQMTILLPFSIFVSTKILKRLSPKTKPLS